MTDVNVRMQSFSSLRPFVLTVTDSTGTIVQRTTTDNELDLTLNDGVYSVVGTAFTSSRGSVFYLLVSINNEQVLSEQSGTSPRTQYTLSGDFRIGEEPPLITQYTVYHGDGTVTNPDLTEAQKTDLDSEEGTYVMPHGEAAPAAWSAIHNPPEPVMPQPNAPVDTEPVMPQPETEQETEPVLPHPDAPEELGPTGRQPDGYQTLYRVITPPSYRISGGRVVPNVRYESTRYMDPNEVYGFISRGYKIEPVDPTIGETHSRPYGPSVIASAGEREVTFGQCTNCHTSERRRTFRDYAPHLATQPVYTLQRRIIA